MSYIRFISDFSCEQINGGGEQADRVLYDLFVDDLNTVTFENCKNVTVKYLQQNKIKDYRVKDEINNIWYIISNFTMLSEDCKHYLIYNCNYILIEHDYKMFAERHPTRYKDNDYIVPKDQLRNVEFYKNAELVICQTKLQKDIISKNLELDNCFSIDGNLFSDEDLDEIICIRNGKDLDADTRWEVKPAANKLYAIINDDNPIKGKQDSIRYADKNKLSYSLLNNSNRKSFLNQLSKFKGIILMPTILESCSRLAIEAKLMGLEVISRNCPIMLQDFNLESISQCRNVVLNKINEVIDGKTK